MATRSNWFASASADTSPCHRNRRRNSHPHWGTEALCSLPQLPRARCTMPSSIKPSAFRFAGPMRCGRCSPTPGWTRSLSALSMSPCTFATSMTTGSPFSAIRALRRPIWPDSTPLRKAVSVGSRRASTTWRAGLPALSPRLSTPIPAGHEQRCPAMTRRSRTTTFQPPTGPEPLPRAHSFEFTGCEHPERRATERDESAVLAWGAQALAGAQKRGAVQRRRLIVFIDESDSSERPTRVHTWAPKGCTPLVQFHFNWKHVSAHPARIPRQHRRCGSEGAIAGPPTGPRRRRVPVGLAQASRLGERLPTLAGRAQDHRAQQAARRPVLQVDHQRVLEAGW